MSLGHRIAITFCIVLGLLFALALYGFLTGAWTEAQGKERKAPPPETVIAALEPPLDPKHERKLLDLDRGAIEQAYYDQIRHVFEIWMKDDTDQPRRAIV